MHIKSGMLGWICRFSLVAGLVALVGISPMFLPASARAFRFDYGDLQGSLDTTLSYGSMWRVTKADKNFIGISNGGKSTNVNTDDGNQNYKKGLVSNVFKVTSDLDLAYENFGVFFRGNAFYDIENEDGHREREALGSDAKDLVGSDIDLLDAYVWAKADIFGMPMQIRVGDQVVSWGESTFFGNSINAINPINVAAIRLPGAELKEAFIPEGMVWASIGLSENVSLEGFYLYDWSATVIEPRGSYFSNNDILSDDGSFLVAGMGDVPESALRARIPRQNDKNAGDDGQFGVALRVYAPGLHDTEFGFYYMNYHSRVPILSGIKGPALPPPYFIAPAMGGYFAEYPEDIQLLGLSAATEIGGFAVQGEVSHRLDMPLQISTPEVTKAVLGHPYAPSQIDSTYAYGDVIHGFVECDVTQVQTTLTKLTGPVFGADSFLFVGEVAVNHVHNMPEKSELRLHVGAFPPKLSQYVYGDASSWGYQVVTKLNYSAVIGTVNLAPRVVWRQDVNGNTPGPGGQFIEGRKAVTLGLGADYRYNWSADLSYTNFFGAKYVNQMGDRDLVAFNLKYSF